MKGIRVDPKRRAVRAQGGVTWGEFDRETLAFDLVTTGGAVSTTGIAGLTLGSVAWWMPVQPRTASRLSSFSGSRSSCRPGTS
jgi:FAD/FMN-containing dehydrogenase